MSLHGTVNWGSSSQCFSKLSQSELDLFTSLEDFNSWLEIQPTGTLNLNIRDAFKLNDGHNLLATVTGRSVPNDVAGPKMESGKPVSGDEMYFVLSLLMETSSEKYGWVNDRVFIGQMDELIMPSEEAGRIKYNVFCVEYETAELKI